MRLISISLHNYKSLRSVTLQPGSLAVLVGPNGAGKSNFCDALDFIGEMYRIGLELAVVRHGGYENIAFRHNRRSKAPITIEIHAGLNAAEVTPFGARTKERRQESFSFRHSISFGTSSQSIVAPFKIIDETVALSVATRTAASKTRETPIFTFSRKLNRIVHSEFSAGDEWFHEVAQLDQNVLAGVFSKLNDSEGWLKDTQSLSAVLEARVYPFINWSKAVGSIGLFQVNPYAGREPGVPTPQPELELTRKRGHLSIRGGKPLTRSPHAKNATALPARVSRGSG